MITRNDIALIGKFNKTHGINGEISASINVPIDVVKECSCLVCEVDGIFVPFFVKEIRNKSSESFLFSIDDINSENDALRLAGKDIYVIKDEYTKLVENEEQLPIDFLIGFKTIINSSICGTIVDIDDSTVNVLFAINIENGKSLLVPAVDEFIRNINSKQRVIEMEIPEELFEL